MTITALEGPFITFRSGTLGPEANSNPEAAPNLSHLANGLLDTRSPFTYYPGQNFGSKTYGFLSSRYIGVDQVPSAIAAANIAASQTPGAATTLTLVSSTAAGITVGTSIVNATTGATVTGLLAIDTAMAGVAFGQAATVQIWDPTKSIARNVRITSGGNDSGLTFLVSGYDLYGYPMSEAITGANAGVASGKKAFKYIASVTLTGGTVATTCSVGTGDVFGYPQRVDRYPYAEDWWGSPAVQSVGGGATTVLEIPVQLLDLASTTTLNIDAPFDGKITSVNFRVLKPATTAAKAATLTAQVSGTNVTGGVVSLTSTNCTPAGAQVAGTGITALNSFTTGQTIGVNVTTVTAFVEGDGIIELTVINNDVSGGIFTAADTTSPATTTTGDVRGTYAVPSASDGTKRLTVFVTIPVSNISTVTGVYGVTQT